MKKIFAILIAAMMVLSLAACSGAGQGEGANALGEPAATQAPAPQKIADDTTAVSLSFTPPEGYDTVMRHFEYAADGSVIDKSFSYTFADKSEVMIGYTKGKQLTDEIPQKYLDEAEIIEYSGKSFYVVTKDKNIMGVCQDNDVVYGLGWSFAEEADRDKFNKLMDGISITDPSASAENGDDIFDIRYTPDSALNVVTTSNNLTQTAGGEAVEKSITRYYGKDEENIDFRLMVKAVCNSTVEKELPENKKTGDVELGGITYTAVYDSDTAEKPFVYYTQRGGDVYQIRNLGVSDGWGVKRSDESYAALENLMNTVSFVSE